MVNYKVLQQDLKWQEIPGDFNLRRAPIMGGWLVMSNKPLNPPTMIFVPDPNYSWYDAIVDEEGNEIPSGKPVGKIAALIAEARKRDKWSLHEAAEYFAVTVNTIRNWITKAVDTETGERYLKTTHPSPGNPSMIIAVDTKNL